jgi:hypothetical protein
MDNVLYIITGATAAALPEHRRNRVLLGESGVLPWPAPAEPHVPFIEKKGVKNSRAHHARRLIA